MAKELINDFTKGKITSQLIKFALPLFLANILQTIYRTVDTIVVGQVIGNIGISAISIGGDITSFLTVVVMGFSGAAQIIMAQYIGAGKRDKLGKIIGTLSITLGIAAIVMSTAGIILRRNLLIWMNTPESAFDEALAYSTVTMAGLIFVYGYNAISGIMRGVGDSKHPFIFIAISSVCNLGLDILFVVGFNWGSLGAAIATVISQIVSFFSCLIFLILKRNNLGFKISRSDWKIDKEIFGSIVKLGFPMALRSGAVTLSKLFTNSYINSYGLIVCTVTGIGSKICSMAALISDALSVAGASMIGQNIGAEKYNRVLKILLSAFVICVSTSIVCAAALLIFPKQVFGLFTSDYSLMDVAMEYVPILVIMFFANATRSSAQAFINGSGNHIINLIVAILDAFVMRVGLGLLLGLACGMEYKGFWLGNTLSTFLPLIIGGIYLLSGKWKTRKYIIRH